VRHLGVDSAETLGTTPPPIQGAGAGPEHRTGDREPATGAAASQRERRGCVWSEESASDTPAAADTVADGLAGSKIDVTQGAVGGKG